MVAKKAGRVCRAGLDGRGVCYMMVGPLIGRGRRGTREKEMRRVYLSILGKVTNVVIVRYRIAMLLDRCRSHRFDADQPRAQEQPMRL